MGPRALVAHGDCAQDCTVRAAALLAAMAALAALAAGADGARSTERSLGAFRGTGTWISIYDRTARRHPDEVAARLREYGIDTLFLQTSNDRQRRAVAHPVATARLLDAAHDAGARVVGWYVPGFRSPRRDVEHALAGARFRSPRGDGFDAFALDVESTEVRSLATRSARAVAVARRVRAGLPVGVALGAISIDPAGARYWDGYPFAGLARSVDVFLPMEYFTYRARGAARVGGYSRRDVALVRRLAGDPAFPVHPIGGVARAATLPELRAFLRVNRREIGVSLWEYGETSATELALLAAR
jgi:hypothetical protein